MENEFIETDGYILGVKGEKTIKEDSFNLPSGCVQVLVTEQPTDTNGEDYFNVYVIDEHFKREPINCLKQQIPKEKDTAQMFTTAFLEMQAIEHYLWFKYSTNEKPLSFSVTCYN